MEAAKKQKTAKKGWVTRAQKKLHELIENGDEKELQHGISYFNERLRQFEEAEAAVEYLTESEKDLDQSIQETGEFIDYVTETLIKAERKLSLIQTGEQKLKGGATGVVVGSSHGSSKTSARLPKVELPHFSGNVVEWQNFWDKFTALVDQTDLAVITKFTHLDSCLQGEAKAVIAGLSITSQHYTDACKLLKERYGRKEKIVFAHIQSLLRMGTTPSNTIQSASELSHLYDELQSHVRSLAALNIQGDQYGVFLTPMILSCLPLEIRLEWSRDAEGKEDDLEYLLQFLNKEIRRRDNAESFRDSESSINVLPSAAALQVNTKREGGQRWKSGQSPVFCNICGKRGHRTQRCWDLVKCPLAERRDRVRSQKLCFRCLSKSHFAKNCAMTCNKCRGSHHALLHVDESESSRRQPSSVGDSSSIQGSSSNRGSSENRGSSSGSQTVHVAQTVQTVRENQCIEQNGETVSTVSSVGIGVTKSESTVFRTVIPVARVCVHGLKGVTEATLLFDSGSDRTYVSSDLVKRVGPQFEGTEALGFAAFGGNVSGTGVVRNKYSLKLSGISKSKIETVSAVEVPVICAPLQRPRVPVSVLDSFKYLNLAETNIEAGEHPIDILIGVDSYWNLMGVGLKRHTAGLVAQETTFGWVLSGSLKSEFVEPEGNSTCNVSHQLLCLDSVTDAEIRNFWNLESIGITKVEATPPDPVLKEFEASVTFEDGRYVVSLPWKSDFQRDLLLDNRKSALKRVGVLSQRLDRDDALKSKYNAIFDEYEKLGFIEEVGDDEVSEYPVFYLPHRPVIRLQSTSTKVRPVFDASAKGFNKISLNDAMEAGPSLIPNLVEILLRFRRWQVALTADITKAFLQIGVSRQDRNVHRFLWNHNGKIRTMRFTRVPFGNKASPFLLNATIKHHLSMYPASLVIQELSENLYVDDFLSGADTEEETTVLYETSYGVLKEAGMVLAKCHSNSQKLVDKFRGECGSNSLDFDTSVKVLGVKWLALGDCFAFEGFEFASNELVCTKRTVLSLMSRLFDPLGFLLPFSMTARILFQDIWRSGVDWDTVLPDDLKVRFVKWLSGIQILLQWKLPRCYLPKTVWADCAQRLELHMFCDASNEGYGAVVYLRLKVNENMYSTAYVLSRAKVAPLKKQTIPRLELLGAMVGARLLVFVCRTLKLDPEVVKSYCWTDSTIVLGWIYSRVSKLPVFVANRVSDIQELTCPAQWFHVDGVDNPADLVTRGLTAEKLVSNPLWLRGPTWLSNEIPEAKLARVEIFIADVECPPSLISVSQPVKSVLPVERWHSFDLAMRVTALVIRFVKILKTQRSDRVDITKGDLTYIELLNAKMFLFKCTQRVHYQLELKALKEGKRVPQTSSILKLSPIVGGDNLLRVHGRLQLSSLSLEEKHPIILPSCHLTKLLVRFVHGLLKHAGVNTMISYLRNEYWIVGIRRLAKSVKKECLACQRQDAVACNRPVAPLPALRVNEAAAFSVTGLDFAGPLFCSDQPGSKKYILLFTCAVIRAVHLELTDSMSILDFMLAMRRFVSRRGLPSVVFSDNAKTFLAAKIQMKETYGPLTPQWKFIVPRSPWWGGWWERLVRSVKSGLRKSIGKTSLTRAELETDLIEVEAAVNSRPLTFVGDTVDSVIPLTPSHFLIGKSSSFTKSVATCDKPVTTPLDLQERSELQSLRLKQFWEIWSSEYLRNLPPALSRFSDKGKLLVGNLVLIREDNLKRLEWPLAVVTELHPGSDGIVRSATLKTAKGQVVTRAVQRLHNLEICDEYTYCRTTDVASGVDLDVVVVQDRQNIQDNVENQDVQDINEPTRTRCGRVSRPKVRLDL